MHAPEPLVDCDEHGFAFCCEDAILHLESLVLNNSDADPWQLDMIWIAGIGWAVEGCSGNTHRAAWSRAWKTSSGDSVGARFMAPADTRSELGVFLRQIQSAHVEVTGALLDDVRFHFDFRPTETCLSVLI